jgi:hypothetical protein
LSIVVLAARRTMRFVADRGKIDQMPRAVKHLVGDRRRCSRRERAMACPPNQPRTIQGRAPSQIVLGAGATRRYTRHDGRLTVRGGGGDDGDLA